MGYVCMYVCVCKYIYIYIYIYGILWKWKVTQSCLTFCNPMNCCLPDSSVHGIFQARILEWVTTPFSRGSSQPSDGTWVSCTAGRFFTVCATREAPNIHLLEWSKSVTLTISNHTHISYRIFSNAHSDSDMQAGLRIQLCYHCPHQWDPTAF